MCVGLSGYCLIVIVIITARESDNLTIVPIIRHSDKWTIVVPPTMAVRQSRNARQRPKIRLSVRHSDNSDN
eukprot:1031149-Prymnesium_polylepis.2